MRPAKILQFALKQRRIIGVLVIVATLVLFVRFFVQHPAYVDSLKHVSPLAVGAVVVLNAFLLATLALINQLVLALCGNRLSFKEQLVLTAYSSLANFFGPLQSGPGVRAAYLKTKHNVSLKSFTLASLVQYGCFAVVSAAFLFGGSRPWWQSLIGILAVAGFSAFVIRFFSKRQQAKGSAALHLDPQIIVKLLLLTVLQVSIVAAYYYVELHAIGVRANVHQVVSYAGAANFALFVSLTPDAVGIRESFLVLAKSLHGLSSAVIITANVLDRAAYALFLGIIFVFVLAFHAKERLGVKDAA